MENKCKRCFRPLQKCQSCDGTAGKGRGFFGDLTCDKCDSGVVCPEHGRYWK